jgi:hypothetical protein
MGVPALPIQAAPWPIASRRGPRLALKVLRGVVVEETIKAGAESPQTATSSVSLGLIGA